MLATYLKNSAFDLRLDNTVPLIYNPITNILSHYYQLTPLNLNERLATQKLP